MRGGERGRRGVIVEEGGGGRGDKVNGRRGGTARDSCVEILDHVQTWNSHEIEGIDLSGVVAFIGTTKPVWRGVGFPPEDCRIRVGFDALSCSIGIDDGSHGELGRNDTTLVVDTHQETHDRVEDDPCSQEYLRAVHADAAEEKRYTRNQKARLLVGEDGE